MADIISKYDTALQSDISQRQITEELGIPRSTLQDWIKRRDSIDADPDVATFFESPAGTAFLHRLCVGAHFTMTLLGAGSVRQVCTFFELTGLDRFVASSYGAQQKVGVDIENAVVEFDQDEKKHLTANMEHKEIAVVQDETFHQNEPCLVAIEPVSNYILLEDYAEGRKASDWTSAMNNALQGLPLKIYQSTSDEGKGILRHVKEDLGVHHSPDVFHVQHEVVKATSAPLSARTKNAKSDLEKASEKVNRCIDKKVDYDNKPHGAGRPPRFDKQINTTLKDEEDALRELASAESRQRRAKDSVRKIGEIYHPVDLETGKLKDAGEVSESLENCFSEIETVATEAQLPESCIKRIAKAKKVVVDMVATILFFHLSVRAKVEALSLAPDIEQIMLEKLIPGIYIRLTSAKAKTAETRRRLFIKSEEILSPLRDLKKSFPGIDPGELFKIEKVAKECAEFFQRASSCVEGRNGQLALKHHGLHKLSRRKLSALTCVHNFFITRSDGTTPAERLYGQRPRELFEVLLEKVDLPGRPAQKRSAKNNAKPASLLVD